MATKSFTLTIPLTLDGFIYPVLVTAPTDTPTVSEVYGQSVQQTVTEEVGIAESVPCFGFVNDAIGLIDDANGFVRGAQKTIYITDERYIIRHDFGGY